MSSLPSPYSSSSPPLSLLLFLSHSSSTFIGSFLLSTLTFHIFHRCPFSATVVVTPQASPLMPFSLFSQGVRRHIYAHACPPACHIACLTALSLFILPARCLETLAALDSRRYFANIQGRSSSSFLLSPPTERLLVSLSSPPSLPRFSSSPFSPLSDG